MKLAIQSSTPRPADGVGGFNEWIQTMQKNKVFISMLDKSSPAIKPIYHESKNR